VDFDVNEPDILLGQMQSKGMLTREDCTWLRLVCFSLVEHGPTLAREPSMQLDLEPGPICRRTSDRPICYTAVSDSCRKNSVADATGAF